MFEFFIERTNFGRCFDLRACSRYGEVVDVANPVMLTRLERDAVAPQDPMLRMGQTDAQQLMDELWRAGLRPSEGSGSAGALAAVQNHLEDMRTIALSQLGIVST